MLGSVLVRARQSPLNHKLRSGVNCQGALKQNGVKQRMPVLYIYLHHEYLHGYEETMASLSRFIEIYWDKLTIFSLWVHVALQK